MSRVNGSNAVLTMPEYLYQTYSTSGASPRLYVPGIILVCIACYGYLANLMVIFATIKNKNLHGSCNFFLACGCLCDMFHTSAHWIYVYTTGVTGVNFIPYSTCLWWDTLPQIFLAGSILMTLFVGLERLFSVTFPVAYGAFDKRLIVGAGLLAWAGVAAFFYTLSVMYALSSAGNSPTICMIVNSYGNAVNIMFYFLCSVNILDLIVYSIVWLFLRFKAGMSEESKKVFKSLFVIMINVAVGWLINAFVQAVITPFLPVSIQYDVMIYFGIPPNLASVSGYITLYYFSAEYRRTFREILRMKDKKSGKVTGAVPSAISVSKQEMSRRSA